MVKKKTKEELIFLFTKIHGDKYDYSKIDYINCKIPITIICKLHGEFKQTSSKHLIGRGCHICGGSKKKTTNCFIEEAQNKYGNKFDYSKSNYINSNIPIIIICKIHGEFIMTPKSHLKSSHGCGKCGDISCGIKKRSNTDEFIKNAKKIHGDKYDYSKVDYKTASKNIIIICKLHGEFYQSPNSHLNGRGCLICGGNKKKTTNSFIKESKNKYGDKFDYSKSNYINCKIALTIVCKIHGEFTITPESHLKSLHGCGKCGDISSSIKQKSNTEEFIKKSKKIHGDKYDYSKVDYKTASKNIIIICKLHGEFYQSPNSHLDKRNNGSDCPQCSIISRSLKRSSNTEDFIIKAKKIHGDKYDYSKVDYKTAKNKIIIICQKHGEFTQTPDGHISGNGCIKCNYMGYSKKQIQWLDFISILNNINIQHAINNKEHTIKNIGKVDGYCEENNTVYEFHGDFWHGNPMRFNILDENNMNIFSKKTYSELYDTTIKRDKKIKELGYNLVIMWENQWNKINKLIKLLQNKWRKYKKKI